MIKNERQYRITQAQAAKFRAAIEESVAAPQPKHIQPKLWEAQKAGLKSQLRVLERDLREYERLKSGGSEKLWNSIHWTPCPEF